MVNSAAVMLYYGVDHTFWRKLWSSRVILQNPNSTLRPRRAAPLSAAISLLSQCSDLVIAVV